MEKLKRAITGRRLLAWQAAHLSLQGDKHVRDGSLCQDHSDSRAFDDGAWAYVVVADGHGSVRHFRSDRGSKLAVATMHDVFHSFYRKAHELPEPSVAALSDLWTRETDEVVRRWRAKVHADLVTSPAEVPGKTDGERGLVGYLDDFAKRNGYAQLELLFWQLRRYAEHARGTISKEAEVLGPLPHFADPEWDQAKFGGWQAKAYGTTVLGVLVGPESLHWVQLGDGAMVHIVGGRADYLVPPPAEAFGNLTPSLCDDNAQEAIRRGTSPLHSGQIPSAILLTTDGVPNSYENDAKFFDFCEDLARRAETAPDFSANLPRWLRRISTEGSGDDVSMALAWLTELPTPEKQAQPLETAPEEQGAEPSGRTEPEQVERPVDRVNATVEAIAFTPRPACTPAAARHATRGSVEHEHDPEARSDPPTAELPETSTVDPEAKEVDRHAEDG